MIAQSLIPRSKVILPPLHIKIGIMTQLMKVFIKNKEVFDHVQSVFPGLSKAKIEGGVFCGPDIRKLLKNEEFRVLLSVEERKAWDAFKQVIVNFFGNFRHENYKEIVKNLIDAMKNIGCRMTVKAHFLDAHIDYFPENLGMLSEEQGERFHQELKDFEKRYKGKNSTFWLITVGIS